MYVLCFIYIPIDQFPEDFEEQNILLISHVSHEVSNEMNILPELSVSTILKMVSKVERWRYRVSSRLWSMCCRRRREEKGGEGEREENERRGVEKGEEGRRREEKGGEGRRRRGEASSSFYNQFEKRGCFDYLDFPEVSVPYCCQFILSLIH